MNNSVSFQSIFYDPFKNKIFLRESINGQSFVDSVSNVFEFYIEDPENKSSITDIYGRKVIKKTSHSREYIRQLKESGVFCCETDIPQDIKFLHQRYKGRELNPDIKDFQICYLDIEIETGSTFPKPEDANYPINLITVKLSKQGKTYTFGNRPYEGKENFKYIADETEMLTAFVKFFQKAKVSILTGWNIVGFDIPYIINRCHNLGITECLSPIGKYWQSKRTGEWSIPGVAILDYLNFFKDPKFVQDRQESYTLQYIAMKEVGEGKLELDGFINDAYKKNWKQYVDYNIQDVLLVEKLEKKKKFIEFAINIAHKSLIPIDKVFSASAIIEGQLLIDLHEKNMVMNDREEGIFKDELEGAYVESHPGYYENLLSYDFESLYPNMITHYNISPETLVLNPKNIDGLIKTPLSESHGIYYNRNKGILPTFIEKNKQERKDLKEKKKQAEKDGNKELAEYYDSQQAIRKVLLNSTYGIMSSYSFHYYNINNAKTVTLSGQHIIKHMRDKTHLYFKDYFYKDKRFFKESIETNKIKSNMGIVLDTDSIYISVNEVKNLLGKETDLIKWSNEFNETFLAPFFRSVLNKYFSQFGVENKINFKLEKIISKMVVFGNKNYSTLTLSNEGVVYPEPKMTVTGFSSKRSSTPHFCRVKIDEMLKKFFANPERKYMIEEMRKVKKEYMEAKVEDIAFPRGISDYTKYAVRDTDTYVREGLTYENKCPIHVKAAMVYNYLIKKYDLPNQPANSGSKIKYLLLHPNNEVKTEVVGFIGNCPEYIKKNFMIDYDHMFQVSFLQPMEKLFNAVNWGTIDLNTEDISDYFIE